MKVRVVLLVGLLLAVPPSWAADVTPTESSVRQLLEVTQSRKLMDSMMAKQDVFIQTAINQALAGKTPTAKQQAVIDDTKKKMVALIQQEMRWDVLEPKLIAIYRQSFTEQEVAGILAFYRTPAGQAVITKMPVVMQRTMATMTEFIVSIVPKIKAIESEALQRLKVNGG